ncbi:MAG TPA: DNA polymerase/3'-5' exonuclease PolX [Verrucomicrobiae bacterium]|nr:DNA polymerase/3'-5' exonuclease PolX [Verrucomicrobiae bacterium]
MDKYQVADVLNQIGTLLELKGENPFKTKAYFNGARVLEGLTEPIEKIVSENRLGDLAGIGDALQKKIAELVTTGRLPYYENLKASVPPGLLEMMQVPGVGPKKIKVLYEQLGVDSVDKLESACKDGRVGKLKGFGEKTALNICEGITRRRAYASKHLLSDALLVAASILDDLRAHPRVIRCSTAGSLRRNREVIGDMDFVVSSKDPASIIEFFAAREGTLNVLAKGPTKASVIVEGGIQADLRVVTDAEFPFALLYFTGSKEHNIVMRQRAIERGLRLNEYGLFRSSEETRDPKLLVRCNTEEEVFQELGLHSIPPEMREDCGEFSIAEEGPLPRLIEWSDLRGSLHNHSDWSDGVLSLEQIVKAMMEMGLSYWGITDHSKSSIQANGLDAARLRKQIREVRSINERMANEGIDFRLLSGTEVDILSEGRLDFPDDLLAELDVVVASAHQRLALDEAENTRRIIRAAENRYVHMLGHVTGRLLLAREPQKVNVQAVIDACAETGTWIELNASPDRLDMDWRHWPYARSRKVKCVINCDAHRFEDVGFLRLGANVARKGGLTKADVVNTLPFDRLIKELARKRART